jgi:hypothetical protein
VGEHRDPRWDEDAGRVSRAFNDWYLIDRDQRAFLRVGLRFAHTEYERLWRESGEEPGDPDGSDQLDSFEGKVDDLHEIDFVWMHATGVLRDAVTNFEVYLEKAREEVLRAHGHVDVVGERSPRWRTLVDFVAALGADDVETDAVKRVRDLRHFLTHRRGELRTATLRQQFAKETDDAFAYVVDLTPDDVTAAMDKLACVVRAADGAVYLHTWGERRLPELQPNR